MTIPRKRFLALVGFLECFLTLAGGATAVWGHRRIAASETRVAELRADVEAFHRKIDAIPQREREVIVVRETVAELSRILPSERDVYEFVRRIAAFKEESGVEYSNVEESRKPRQRETASLERFSYRLGLRGDSWQILAFLARLESYERFVRVPRLKIAAGSPPKDGKGEPPRHAAQIEIETFFQPPGKSEGPRVEIANYEAKREELLEQIAKARGRVEVPTYAFRGPRNRRDPFLDPRVPAGTGIAPGLSIEEQTALVERLRTATAALSEDIQRFAGAQDLSSRSEVGPDLDARLQSLVGEVREAEAGRRVTHPPLARRFGREVLEPLDAARALFAAQMDARPSLEDLEGLLRGMRERVAEGDFEGALRWIRPFSDRLAALEKDPARASKVAEIREFEAVVRKADALTRRDIQVRATIVSPNGCFALLDGRVVTEGESFEDGLRVRRIGVNEVELDCGGLVVKKNHAGPR